MRTFEVAATEAVLGVFSSAMLNMISRTVVYLLFVDPDSAMTVHASVIGIVARNKSAYCFLHPPPLQDAVRFEGPLNFALVHLTCGHVLPHCW